MSNEAQIMEKLISLKNKYPNLCAMWEYYLEEKKRDYLQAIEKCNSIVHSLEQDTISENVDKAIPFLCFMLQNNLFA